MTKIVNGEKFNTSVNLSIPYKNNVYQFLYASQLYGTFFGIYGKFKTKIKDGKCEIQGIRFRLINYRGCVNIGLHKIKLDEEATKNNKKETYNIYVKPLIKKDEKYYSFEGKLADPGKEIIFQRLVSPYGSRIPGENDNGEVSRRGIFFDEEFNYRDGYYEVGEEARAGHVDFRSMAIASPRCHQSNVNMFF